MLSSHSAVTLWQRKMRDAGFCLWCFCLGFFLSSIQINVDIKELKYSLSASRCVFE